MYSVFPLQRSSAEWLEDRGEILATWHVFNPNGPTVNCVGLRETGARSEQEVFWRWMHFTGAEDYCLGYVDSSADGWGGTLLEVLRHAFSLPAGGVLRRFPLVTCVPYAVTCDLDADWQLHFRDLFGRTGVFAEADWGRERYRLAKYGSNLFDRAAEEYREAYEQARRDPDPEVANSDYLKMLWLKHERKPAFANWTPGAYASRGLRPGDVEAWWEQVTSQDHRVAASVQVAQAWVGAIWQLPDDSNVVRRQFEEVRDFLVRYGHPIWPADWTSEMLAERMGLRG